MRHILRQANNVVLCFLDHNAHTPFVTWRIENDDPNTSYSGNYFETLTPAVADFKKRSGVAA